MKRFWMAICRWVNSRFEWPRKVPHGTSQLGQGRGDIAPITVEHPYRALAEAPAPEPEDPWESWNRRWALIRADDIQKRAMATGVPGEEAFQNLKLAVGKLPPR